MLHELLRKLTYLSWKGAQLVLFMTTAHRGHEVITQGRKRPAKGSVGAKSAGPIFGNEYEKDLEVPEFIDDYNHFMRGVDIADQFRSYFKVGRRWYRTWKPLFYFLLDVAVINAFRLSAYCDPTHEMLFKNHRKHREFHRRLALALMKRCEAQRAVKAPTVTGSRKDRQSRTYYKKHNRGPSRTTYGCSTCNINVVVDDWLSYGYGILALYT